MSIVAGKPLVTPYNPNKFKPSEEEIKRIVDEHLAENPPVTEESDPTVPAWAKEETKPTYTADEVGARPATWMPTAEDVGAVTSAQVDKKISDHNVGATAHNDLRLALQQLLLKVNNFLDVDEETANQLSELLGLIRDNASDIESITSGKVNVADIVNDLVTNVSNKPLSAAQGVALKGRIDNLGASKLDASKLTEAINTALAQAKASGEFDGRDGDKGDDGYTPEIGANGNWWIKGVDTGKTALGTVINNAYINGEGHLIVSFTDNSTIDAGLAKGGKGDKGDKGDPYTLTDADKNTIVNAVITALPTAEGVEY